MTRNRLVAAFLASLLLAGCALLAGPGQVALGTPKAQVLEKLGAPTAFYPGPVDASARLQYSWQPGGQAVYNIDIEQGQVVRVEQALNVALFAERIQPDTWTRDDVLREYGSPADVMGVHNFDGDIWIWRYLEGPTWRLLYIDIDRGGVVRDWSTGDENLPDPPDPR